MAHEVEPKAHGAEHAGFRLGVVTMLAVALLVAGCDTLPTDPEVTADAAAEAASVQEVWEDLPSTMEMEAETLAGLDQATLTSRAAVDLLDAGELAAEADAALELGASGDAAALEEAADTLATRAFLAVFGMDHASAVLQRVESASQRVEARLQTTASAEAEERLKEAADALVRARAARAAQDPGGMLLHAGRAADALRWLDPEGKAKAAVALAHVFLDRAQRLAGADPEPPIARALAAAEALCGASRRALEAGRWRLAVREARACARLSRAVIARLSGGIDPELLAARAEEAVSNAGALFEWATEQAGESPEARVVLLLDEAEALLGRARIALGEARYRAAIGLAIESSARSIRVLRILHSGEMGPYELRATAAVEVARALAARVDARLDGETAPEIVEAAERADGLLADAEAALEDAAWRIAWGKARTAVGVYVRVLVVLT